MQSAKQTLWIGVELLIIYICNSIIIEVNKLSQRLGISYNEYINPIVPGPEDTLDKDKLTQELDTT